MQAKLLLENVFGVRIWHSSKWFPIFITHIRMDVVTAANLLIHFGHNDMPNVGHLFGMRARSYFPSCFECWVVASSVWDVSTCVPRIVYSIRHAGVQFFDYCQRPIWLFVWKSTHLKSTHFLFISSSWSRPHLLDWHGLYRLGSTSKNRPTKSKLQEPILLVLWNWNPVRLHPLHMLPRITSPPNLLTFPGPRKHSSNLALSVKETDENVSQLRR